MTEQQRLQVIAHDFSARRVALAAKAESLLATLGVVRRDMEEVNQFFRDHPELQDGEVTWQTLTSMEQAVLCFLARRGRMRRVANLTSAFVAEFGRPTSEPGFRSTITRLHARGVIQYGSRMGWTVSPALLTVALDPPVDPKVESVTGWEGLARRIRSAPRRQPAKAAADAQRSPVPPATPAEVYARIPQEGSITLMQLSLMVGVRSKVERRQLVVTLKVLQQKGLVRQIAPETYSRGPDAALTRMQETVRALLSPTDARSNRQIALLVFGEDTRLSRQRACNHLKRLVQAGKAARVGRGLYRLLAESEVVPEAPAADEQVLVHLTREGTTLPDLVRTIHGTFTPRLLGEVRAQVSLLVAQGAAVEEGGRVRIAG